MVASSLASALIQRRIRDGHRRSFRVDFPLWLNAFLFAPEN
jgi:hypothetical protein